MLHHKYDGWLDFLENNADMAGPGGSPAYFKPGAGRDNNYNKINGCQVYFLVLKFPITGQKDKGYPGESCDLHISGPRHMYPTTSFSLLNGSWSLAFAIGVRMNKAFSGI